MHGLAVCLMKEVSFIWGLSIENSQGFVFVFFDWLYFIWCLTSFSCIDHRLCHCVQFLAQFYQT